MRFSTHVVLFILVANALIGAASTAGMWNDWGIKVSSGVSQSQIDNTTSAFKKVTSGNLGASTLISSYVFATEAMNSGWQIVTALPSFLENIGVPGFIAAIPNVLVVILVGRDAWNILTRRNI